MNSDAVIRNPSPERRHGLGITLRAAAFSWLVTIVTLVLFVSVIIPLQRETLLENLRTKARAVTASLEAVAAGAAVRGDFSSVVHHCRETLDADKAIEYLVITRDDGYSVVSAGHRFRIVRKSPPEWHPKVRQPSSGLGRVSFVHRRVFHYSVPFDHSGVHWGWLHVGLSLEGYDRDMAAVYRRTLGLALLCAVLSLGLSLVGARLLVPPLLPQPPAASAGTDDTLFANSLKPSEGSHRSEFDHG